MPRRARFAALALLLAPGAAPAQPVVVTPALHHLRSGPTREWADFPERAEGAALTRSFTAAKNAAECTLRLRHQDVKQGWKVVLNGRPLGALVADENDAEVALRVPPGALRDGENVFTIEAAGKLPDDVRVGEVALDPRPVKDVLSEATLDVEVREEGLPGGPRAVPCRITIVSARGALAATGAVSTDRHAVRPGVVYTADGSAVIPLPAGEYTVYAGRGPEYSLASVRATLGRGGRSRQVLAIRREVPTAGWAACDTHVHTLTHSGHGDCTDVERAVTLAGEGVELPVAAEHNRQVDYAAAARNAGVGRFFTPVVGNEVTTGVGHFNVFPLAAGSPPPDHRAKGWADVRAALGPPAGPRLVVLNHPRDLHAGFRPFDPVRHLAPTGERLDGWAVPANAMEVVNSGAQQTDVMRLVHDWFGLLNAGALLTPIGSSDSHDVSRYIVGQGRTYVRCDDSRPGEIDVAAAVKNAAEGRVSVSCGLLCKIVVNGKSGPGDLAPGGGPVVVRVRVLGPSWVTADRVELYCNGRRVREEQITGPGKGGVKWEGEWSLPAFPHDVHLTAVATGPGVDGLYWPIARPYQPTSPVVRKRVIGVTGAVWVDGDGDGRRTPPADYARRVVDGARGDWKAALRGLATYDEAVAAQGVGRLRSTGRMKLDQESRAEAVRVGGAVLRGYDAYAEAWRESVVRREEGVAK